MQGKQIDNNENQLIKYNKILNNKINKLNSKNKKLNKKRTTKKETEKPFQRKMLRSTSRKFNHQINNNNYQKEKINTELTKNFGIKKIFDCYELNNMEYLEAKKYDKRNCFKIYWSFLKREHSIIFAFIARDDYNITMIKCSRFIFLLSINMAMNVFFYADETMHKMFLDYGKYNFIQQIPQIIYSTIISKLFEILLCFLSMTDKYYYQIKNAKNMNKHSFSKIKKSIKRKIVFFFIFTILIFSFNWYLITCFCAVYKNTQIAFLKDSLSSFILDNLIPFVIYLFPSLLRIISLKSNIFCSKCIY